MIFSFRKDDLPSASNPNRAERGRQNWLSNGRNTNSCQLILNQERGRKLFDAISGNSPFLSQIIEQEAEFALHLFKNGPEKTFADILLRLDAWRDQKNYTNEIMPFLRRSKKQAALVIAVADIAGVWSIEKVMRRLSEFAEKAISLACCHILARQSQEGKIQLKYTHNPERSSGYFILALGKLGARELNYSSDVDLVVFYDPVVLGANNRGIVNQIAIQATKSLIRILGEQTSDGYVLRVDLRLRPDPGSTPIAVSVDSAQRYYENSGQNWERMAFIRARPIAGDIELGKKFLLSLQPFMWRKNLDFAAIEDIHSIKRQISSRPIRNSNELNGHNIKLGKGGIREIEFFIQTQQLIWAGRYPELRHEYLLKATSALMEEGKISKETAQEIRTAYLFLRKIEHRLQMINDQQTHQLPKSDQDLENVAIFSGFGNVTEFKYSLLSVLNCVQEHYADLFETSPNLSLDGSLVFTGNELHPDTILTLKTMGFSQPKSVFNIVSGWHYGRYPATRDERARQLLTELMPQLLSTLSNTIDPDFALTRFDRFLQKLPSGVQFFSLIKSNQKLLEFLALIMGDTPSLAEWLSRSPTLFDSLITEEITQPIETSYNLKSKTISVIPPEGNIEDFLDLTRRSANEQKFKIQIQVLQNIINTEKASQLLTSLAQTVFQEIWQEVERDFVRQHGKLLDSNMIAIAYGKFGGRELMPESDLDLVFLYNIDDSVEKSDGVRPLQPTLYFTRLAQRICSALSAPTAEGKLYEIDIRLRPTGRVGPAVVQIDRYFEYLKTQAWTWELMALTRARPVAGPEEVQTMVCEGIRTTLTSIKNEEKLRVDAVKMRKKMITQQKDTSKWNIKHRIGGLVDIEFILQFLQLANANHNDQILSTSTLSALRRLKTANILCESAANSLEEAFQFLQWLQFMIRIIGPNFFEREELQSRLLKVLVRHSSFSTIEEIIAEMDSQTDAVQRQFYQVFRSHLN